MNTRYICQLLVALVVSVACTSAEPASGTSTDAPTTAAPSTGTPTTEVAEQSRPIAAEPAFEEVEPGTYYIEHDRDAETTLTATLTVPEGWHSWVGAFKPVTDESHEYVGVTIASPRTVVRDPCSLHTFGDPGPRVDDLANALAALPGMVVIEAPADTTAFGFPGRHLILQVPDLVFDPGGSGEGFVSCSGGRSMVGRLRPRGVENSS